MLGGHLSLLHTRWPRNNNVGSDVVGIQGGPEKQAVSIAFETCKAQCAAES